jgi:hypothetical protein
MLLLLLLFACYFSTHLDILVIQWAVEALRVARILALLLLLQESRNQTNTSRKL